ncbi:MAG: hypothetical protein P1V97_31700 [Planctomycetota bacterium]|nr:hypothetical protein [Planctomycetota bacterium]
MSEEILALKTQIAYLESDVERLTGEARERDKVINELYEKVANMETSVMQLVSTNLSFGHERPPHSIGDLDDRLVDVTRMEEKTDLTLDPRVGDELK